MEIRFNFAFSRLRRYLKPNYWCRNIASSLTRVTIKRAFITGLATSLMVVSIFLFQFSQEEEEPPSQPWSHELARSCHSRFGNNPSEDRQRIRSYTFPEAEKYLNFVFARKTKSDINIRDIVVNSSKVEFRVKDDSEVKDDMEENLEPMLVTGSSSNHFSESLDMLRELNNGLRKTYQNLKLIYYDLGLNRFQKKKVIECCDCEVRKFPFEMFPKHVAYLKGYVWKPIAIQSVLNEYKFVIWLDSSARISSINFESVRKRAKERGILCTRGYGPVAVRTLSSTFEYLGESPCLFRARNEIQGGLLAVYDTEFSHTYIMKPWVSCGLNLGCMVPNFDKESNQYCPGPNRYHLCHRYDQSVLSILIYRLFHSDMEPTLLDNIGVKYSFIKDSETYHMFISDVLSYINTYNREC